LLTRGIHPVFGELDSSITDFVSEKRHSRRLVGEKLWFANKMSIEMFIILSFSKIKDVRGLASTTA